MKTIQLIILGTAAIWFLDSELHNLYKYGGFALCMAFFFWVLTPRPRQQEDTQKTGRLRSRKRRKPVKR